MDDQKAHIVLNQVIYSGKIGFGRKRTSGTRLRCLGRSNESLPVTNAEFHNGRVYGIIGPFGAGGWALSWLVAGLLHPSSGHIELNGEKALKKDLRAKSIAVGELLPKWKEQYSKTIGTQLMSALQNDERRVYEIVSKFSLSPERLDRRINQLSNERWRASAAIGVAVGKEIFCFPWISSDYLTKYRHVWFEKLLGILREYRVTVLVPTDYDEELLSVFDDTFHLSMPAK